MSDFPALPQLVQPSRESASRPTDRKQAKDVRDRFAESLATARTLSVSERAANDGPVEARRGKVASGDFGACHRDSVQTMLLSGAMKFAASQAVASQPDMVDLRALPEAVTGDALPVPADVPIAVELPIAVDVAAPEVELPPVSWSFPTVESVDLSIADEVIASLPDVIELPEDVPADDLASTPAATAAWQLIASLPLEIVAPEPAPAAVPTDGEVQECYTSEIDVPAAPLGAAVSTMPDVTALLVEDHFDAPAASTERPAAEAVVETRATTGSGTVRVDRNVVHTDIKKLSPEFRERLEKVMERMRLEYGHTVRVVETVRSQDRQDALFAQGRTAPGPVVTWTKNSKHIKGLAADLIVDGAWNNPEGYQHLAEIAKQEGLRTLGSRDAGHVEMIGGTPVSGETIESLLQDLQGDAGDAAREVQARVMKQPEPEPREQETHSSAMARVANVAQVARVATVASVATVAKVASVARPREGAPRSASGGEAFAPLVTNLTPSVVSSADTASHVATPISSVNLADRISHLMDLQATQSAKPLNSVLLRMGNAGGIDDQIRIDTRGTSVDARLGLGNAQQAAALSDRLGELREALERRGLTADGVRVQTASAARPVDATNSARSIAPTLELAALRAAADAQAQGNSRDQSARDQAQREAFARDQSRHTPRPSSDDARNRSRREQQEERR